jgi:alpha-D-ribose 1-methylphosphonate 5-triphosphate synthase subunit PhnH
MSIAAVAPGFTDAVHDAQKVFRAVMGALARPGHIARLDVTLVPPPPLYPTAAAILLALADFETTIWLDDVLSDHTEWAEFLRFHTGARLTSSWREANFALISAPERMPALATFAQGTPEYPDRSTTLVVQVEAMTGGGWQFTGPGIPDRVGFSATPMPLDFQRQLAENRSRFPLGVDLMFATATDIAALPRSARIAEGS